ncbi:MAG: HNH endonuclease [Ponticaulis sp.]|nr:HNH endonuclease [Ponticaulis sp.]|tara:strand:+ start:131 stop:385 length:255 start_codon:yes stop_codon:yes gene_type:complete
MSQPFKPVPTELFETLWEHQQGLCALCAKPMPKHRFELAHARLWAKWRPTYDHIIPRSKGGRDVPDNLQLAHAICNKIKGNRIK